MIKKRLGLEGGKWHCAAIWVSIFFFLLLFMFLSHKGPTLPVGASSYLAGSPHFPRHPFSHIHFPHFILIVYRINRQMYDMPNYPKKIKIKESDKQYTKVDHI